MEGCLSAVAVTRSGSIRWKKDTNMGVPVCNDDNAPMVQLTSLYSMLPMCIRIWRPRLESYSASRVATAGDMKGPGADK